MEYLKTNEFQTRRRLRMQQVREQSKELAREVRERAGAERSRQLSGVQQTRREDYVERQERVVQRLERIHEGALCAVGSAHSQAANINENEKNIIEPKDQSKQRAKVAVQELNRNKQQELDKKKQQLERKLIARKLANARSRSKLNKTPLQEEVGSGDAVKKNISNSDLKFYANGSDAVKKSTASSLKTQNIDNKDSDIPSESAPKKNDMETQWSLNGLREWTPSNVLSSESLQDNNSQVNNISSARDCEKNTNLFAVSAEMPEDLLGNINKKAPAVDLDNKPSVTIVSDFLRTRDHRLKKPTPGFHKVSDHELQGLRETFANLRTSRKDFALRGTEDICRVVDDDEIPTLCWEPGPKCGFCKVDSLPSHESKMDRNLSHVNRVRTRSRSAVSLHPCDHSPSKSTVPASLTLHPVSGATVYSHQFQCQENTSPSKLSKLSASGQSQSVRRNRSVMHYDHATKAIRDIPVAKDSVVEKITVKDLDAYSLAVKESEQTVGTARSRREVETGGRRSRIAVSRQRVAHEYKDTMAFLQSLSTSNDKSKPIESSYMDDYQQHKKSRSLQRKLQQEFEKVQAASQHKARPISVSEVIPKADTIMTHKSKEPPKSTINCHHQEEDTTNTAKTSLNDAEALLHQIGTSMTVREDSSAKLTRNKDEIKKSSKAGNTVTFDITPSTYTYTSRVKHTPPTRDKPSTEDQQTKDNRNIDIEVIEPEHTCDDALISDCSSDYDLIIQRHNKPKSKESSDTKTDVRKFIVYKIKDQSDDDAIKKIRNKNKTKDKSTENKVGVIPASKSDDSSNENSTPVTCEELKKSREHTGVEPEKDGQKLLEKKTDSDFNCWCKNNKGANEKEVPETNTLKSSHKSKKPLQWDIGVDSPESQENCKCRRSEFSEVKKPAVSAATSAATFKTATSEKSSSEQSVVVVPQPGAGGYVKVLDEAGAEAGKFYIGASNLSRDDPYEVIIQLKRKNERSDKGTENNQRIRTLKPMIYSETENALKTVQKPTICKCSTLKTPVQDAQFSSSSSTVYMSPPDLILPKVLKVDNPLAIGGVNKAPQMNLQNVKQEESISLSHYIRRNQPRPGKESEVKIEDPREPSVRSPQKINQHMKLTSKSASSTSTVTAAPSGDYKRIYSDSSCNSCLGNKYRSLHRKKTCKRSTTKLEKSKRTDHHKYKQHQLEKRIFEHYQNHMHNMLKNDKIYTKVPSSTKSQSNLSPSIKKYINKLLKMDKDEPTSDKISALHCSTVSTPGSSVVNVPSNVDPKWSEWEQDLIQAKLNEIITKNVMKKLQSSEHKSSTTRLRQNLNHSRIKHFQNTEAASTSTSSDLQSIERGVGDVPRLHLHRLRKKPKSVYRNKVKSLNISKNIIKYLQTVDSERHEKSVYLTKSTSKLNSSDAEQRSSDVTKRFNKYIRTPKGKPGSRNSPMAANIVNKSSNANVGNKTVQNIKNYKSKPQVKRVSSAPNKHITINVDERNKTQISSKNKPMVVDPKRKEAVIYSQILINESPADKEGSERIDAVITQNSNAPSVEANRGSNSDNVVLIAEEKLQKMEKIADLTEKCTKRLSNLAKVLDEVRKNKSTVYNQMSSSDTSLSEKSSGKRENSFASKCELDIFFEKPTDAQKFTSNNKTQLIPSEITSHNITENKYQSLSKDNKHNDFKIKEQQILFVPILGDIPKPDQSLLKDTQYEKLTQSNSVNIAKFQTDTINASTQNEETVKIRAKPPPALYRVNLKNEETVVPHELSTVLEVDSPMSARNASSRVRTNDRSPININVVISSGDDVKPTGTNVNSNLEKNSAITPSTPVAPPVSPSSADHKRVHRVHLVNKENNKPFSRPGINTADEFKIALPSSVRHEHLEKLQMIDLNEFNEIMMKPFISIEEYARQYDAVLLEEASNFEDTALSKNTPNRDEELSSDATLPDIISELLKRNIISEPFNFDGLSNVDSNALSSESNLSLALSKVKRNTKKVTINANNQDNGDTSDTLSFSSKADLEKAFEELGIGWASSTLKKTKETLALSSSTSTVSSIDHTNYRKLKKFNSNKQLFKAAQSLISDKTKTNIATMEPIQAASGIPPDSENKENVFDAPKQFSKHSVQLQTSSLSFQPPVSVKEFLTSSLADKITFASKSPRPKVEEHYSSLYSTKLSTDNLFGNSVEKAPATDTTSHLDVTKQTRQRTSTPVQLFKSLTFNSSTSSYNNSNGLFSNVDDLSSVKGNSVSLRNSSSTDRDELTVPNYSLKVKNLD